MMPILGSPESEWLVCLAIFHACSWCLFLALQFVSGYFALQYFMPAHDACSWLSSLWVATLPCNISCLFMMSILGSPESEWLLCLARFHACSWCLYLTLQNVSGYFALFHACSWCLFLALQEVSALPYFMPDYDAFTWLSRLWVATLLHHVLCLLMTPVLDSPGCQWLLYLVMFYACSWCSWLSRKSVTAVPCHILCLLIMPVLGSLDCEWLFAFP